MNHCISDLHTIDGNVQYRGAIIVCPATPQLGPRYVDRLTRRLANAA
jgi:hypothetical protein